MFITVKLTIFLLKWHCTAIQLQYTLNILSTPFLWLSTTQYSNNLPIIAQYIYDGVDLGHPIQSTTVLCDIQLFSTGFVAVATCPVPPLNTGTSSSVSPSSSTFATTSDDGPDSSREEDPQQMTVILTSVIATLVMVTLLTCTVMIVALVFCYRANISETSHSLTCTYYMYTF